MGYVIQSLRMSECDRLSLPEWAERERGSDLAWIGGNLHVLWPVARQGYDEFGRGAIVVDTTLRPAGAGHPGGYVSQEMIKQISDDNSQGMVKEYVPSSEFVAVLLKSEDRVSSYRLQVSSDAAEQRTEPPDLETLMSWEAEGGCEATDGCWVEPDGTCPHGHRSWLLELGLI